MHGNDIDLASKVKAGDKLYLPLLNIYGASISGWGGVGIEVSVVVGVTKRTITVQPSSGISGTSTLRHCEGFRGYQQTFDAAFKVGREQLENRMAIMEQNIKETKQRWRLWDRLSEESLKVFPVKKTT